MIPLIRSGSPACSERPSGTAAVEDLGRGLRLSPAVEPGGRQLVLDLSPFGVAAIRVVSPRVQLSSVTPYPSESVRASMQSRFDELTVQLSRLNRGPIRGIRRAGQLGIRVGSPPNRVSMPGPQALFNHASCEAGFEQPVAPSPMTLPVDGESKLTHSASDGKYGAITIDQENPHLGQGSLRLSASRRSGLRGERTVRAEHASEFDDSDLLPCRLGRY